VGGASAGAGTSSSSQRTPRTSPGSRLSPVGGKEQSRSDIRNGRVVKSEPNQGFHTENDQSIRRTNVFIEPQIKTSVIGSKIEQVCEET